MQKVAHIHPLQDQIMRVIEPANTGDDVNVEVHADVNESLHYGRSAIEFPTVIWRLLLLLYHIPLCYMTYSYFSVSFLFVEIKLENVLIDSKGNVKITDFGLSALPQDLRGDGLLHTTCGSPNYVAPEVLSNRGYDDGTTSDTWSCGVILYVILTGYLPFDDRNLAVLYQKGDAQLPKWLSPSAQNLVRRILDPIPCTRITMEEIKVNEWFKQGYSSASPIEDEEENVYVDDLEIFGRRP